MLSDTYIHTVPLGSVDQSLLSVENSEVLAYLKETCSYKIKVIFSQLAESQSRKHNKQIYTLHKFVRCTYMCTLQGRQNAHIYRKNASFLSIPSWSITKSVFLYRNMYLLYFGRCRQLKGSKGYTEADRS